jgi:hypothetical protein
MTPTCDHCGRKLVRKRHGSQRIWQCRHNHTRIKRIDYSESNECKNCHRQLPNKFAHVNGC